MRKEGRERHQGRDKRKGHVDAWEKRVEGREYERKDGRKDKRKRILEGERRKKYRKEEEKGNGEEGESNVNIQPFIRG